MVSEIESPTQLEVIYPDCDGQPIANDTEQFRWILLIEQNLEGVYARDPNVFIAGDLFWYPVQGNNKIFTAPDVMVALGRPKGKRLSYKQWEEGNVAPQIVFEILSPSNTQDEMDRKLVFYERYGVEEYYIYNPANNQLRVWLRGEAGLDLIESVDSWASPRLGIRFDLSGEELQIYGPDGTPFLSYLEIEKLLKQERQRAEQKRQRAEQERQRAEKAAQQMAEMEELLKRYRDRFGDLPE